MRRRFRHWLRCRLEGLVEVEVIGQAECPVMLRWTFLNLHFLKAMVHYFPPNVSDHDPHDHPRSFATFVLRGRYFDTSWESYGDITVPTIEVVQAGEVRYRPAKYLHIVETDDRGAWSIVIMGPVIREWGFMRLSTGLWWQWGRYIQRFGGVARCDAPPDMMGQENSYRDYKGTAPPVS